MIVPVLWLVVQVFAFQPFSRAKHLIKAVSKLFFTNHTASRLFRLLPSLRLHTLHFSPSATVFLSHQGHHTNASLGFLALSRFDLKSSYVCSVGKSAYNKSFEVTCRMSGVLFNLVMHAPQLRR